MVVLVSCQEAGNRPPLVAEDLLTAEEDMVLEIELARLLDNDTDPDGDTLSLVSVQDATLGAAELIDGRVRFTPAPDANGLGSFSYSVTDGVARADALVRVDIRPSNDPPRAIDDDLSGREDEPLTLNVEAILANDIDVDGDRLVLESIDAGRIGPVSVTRNEITLMPLPDLSGTHSFTYRVSDGAISVTGVGRVLLTPVDDAPRPVDDEKTTDEDVPLVFREEELLVNDVEVDDEPLSIEAASVRLGAVTRNGGWLVYTPPADGSGRFELVYSVTDGRTTVPAVLSIRVTSINDAPRPMSDAAALDEDTPIELSTRELLENDVDVDGPSLSVSVVGPAVRGRVELVQDAVRFSPDANFHGPASFRYTVTDGSAVATATVVLVVRPIDDTPIPRDDTASTDEDNPLEITAAAVLMNDVEVDGDPLEIVRVERAVGGQASLANGRFRFTPTPDLNGVAAFRYVLSDGNSEASAQVVINIRPVNDAPLALDDALGTDEDVALTVSGSSLANNDVDIDMDSLSVVSVQNAVGGAVQSSAGSIVFSPDSNFHGVARFEYTVSDGTATDDGQVVVNVRPINDAPSPADDVTATSEDVELTTAAAALLSNDTDVEGDSLTLVRVENAVSGTVRLVQGQVIFLPAPDFHGTASFAYVVSDGQMTANGRVQVRVAPVNDAPRPANDLLTTAEDTQLSLSAATLLANDVDVDGDPLQVVAVQNPNNGSVTLAHGQIVFRPAPDFFGTADFEYRVSDGALETNGRAVVQVTGVNDAPVATDDTARARADASTTIPSFALLANDVDVDGDRLSITGVTAVSGGTPTLGPTGATFNPATNFAGTAQFDYVISDGTATDTGRVTLTVSRCVLGTDLDNDRLDDCYETATLWYISPTETGTRPTDPDTDGDGLLDGVEVNRTAGGLDLLALGANPLRKDIFIEYDWFDDSRNCGAHSHRPTAAMAAAVVNAFRDAPVSNPDGSTGISIHQDYGQGGGFTGGNLIPDLDGVLSDTLGTEFYGYKRQNFASNRDGYFHYTIMPHHYAGNSPSSGVAEINGDDLVVSLQCFLTTSNVAHTILHELGHNLGLRHGGNENCNYKPNYNSVMNYRFQFPGIDGSNCDADGDGILSYSRGTRIALDEQRLDERQGVCGSRSIDWNRNGTIEGNAAVDINSQGNSTCPGGTLTVLRDFDDWASLFFRGIYDATGASVRTVVTCDSSPASLSTP